MVQTGTAKQALPLPSPIMLRRSQAAQYLGMSLDMFDKNISDGVIEHGSKLRPLDEKSVVLGWSIQKLERARAVIDGETTEAPDVSSEFETALANFGGTSDKYE